MARVERGFEIFRNAGRATSSAKHVSAIFMNPRTPPAYIAERHRRVCHRSLIPTYNRPDQPRLVSLTS